MSYWRLESASDCVGVNTLTNNGGVTFVAGKIGKASNHVNSSTQHLSLVAPASLSVFTALTFAGWFNLATLSGNRTIMGKRSGGNIDYYLRASSGNSLLTFAINAGGSTTPVDASTFGVLSLATWYFFCGRWDGTNAYISINGGAENSIPKAGALANLAPVFSIGSRGDGGDAMDGMVDEIGVWNRSLTATEIAVLYNSGTGLTHPFAGL